MSEATARRLLPYILAARARKPVAHDEALRLLDGQVQLSPLEGVIVGLPVRPAAVGRFWPAHGKLWTRRFHPVNPETWRVLNTADADRC